MTTRTGRPFKRTMEPEHVSVTPTESDSVRTPTEGGTTPTTAPHTSGDIASIVDVMRGMMQDRDEERRRYDAERAEERRRYEEEAERRDRAMMKQMEFFQRMVSEREEKVAKSDPDPVKLTRLSDTDDIESYLTTFERIMKAYEVDPARWAYKLAPQLTGKAQQAYAALDPDEAESYASVKAAILRRYNIHEETYRKRFRGLQLKSGETPTELATRLADLANKWLKDCGTVAEVKDAVVREQLMATLPDDVRVWVSERKPKTTAEAGQLADDYLQAHASGTLNTKSPRLPPGPCPRCWQHGHWASECPNNPKTGEPTQQRKYGPQNPQTPQFSSSSQPLSKSPLTYTPTMAKEPQPQFPDGTRCYSCKEKGHLSYNCPQRSSLYCDAPDGGCSRLTKETIHSSIQQGTINNLPSKILLDTGTTQSMVHKDFISDGDILEEHTTIRCAHGDSVAYPLATIIVQVGRTRVVVKAAVSSTLPQDAIIGWDAPEILTMLTQPTKAYTRQLSKRVGIGTYWKTTPRLRRRRRRGKCEGPPCN